MQAKSAPRSRYPRGPRVSVIVDADLIEISKERDSSHCMIAEAIRDVVPHAKSVAVDVQTIRFSDPNKRLRYTYLTPRIAQVALVNFDQGITPEPLTFIIQGPHVTPMAKRKNSGVAPRPRSEKQQEALEKGRQSLTKTIILPSVGGGGGKVAQRIGGKPAPLSAFARRRSFGLRALTL